MGPMAGITALAFTVLGAVPWRLRQYAFAWGASADDLRHSWPGDDLCPDSVSVSTRGIDVAAPGAVVWSYVAQMGQDRAGFYSYRWLENLFGCDMPRVESIVPEWQERAVGDNVWLARRDRFNGDARVKVVRFNEGRDMVLTSPADWGHVLRHEHARGGSWTLVVISIGPHRCRLVSRSRGPERAGAMRRLWNALVLEPAHFVMERRMMVHIKELSERRASCSCETSCQRRS